MTCVGSFVLPNIKIPLEFCKIIGDSFLAEKGWQPTQDNSELDLILTDR